MKNELNLLILHNIISPYRLPLFQELSKKYNIEVYFCKKNNKDRLWSASLDNYSFNFKILPSFNFGPLVVNLTLIGELFKTKYDCYVIAENPENTVSVLLTFIIAKIFKKKIVLWNERVDNEILTLINLKESKKKILNLIYMSVRKIYKLYRKLLYSNSNVVIALSKAVENYLLNENVNENRIINSFQIVPESILRKNTRLIKFKNKQVILSLCYLYKRKGVDSLIEAFKILNKKDVILLIAGSGDQEHYLRKIAANNNNIIFLGYIDGVKKANYYSSADIFIFPTHYDVWGLVVNEALYYGLPVISSDKASASNIIEDGKTGYIFPDNNIQELSKKMKKLLDNHSLLNEMKRNVKNMNKDKLVNVNLWARSFEEAIYFVMK